MNDPQIYIQRHGKSVGPYSIGSIRAFIAHGSISTHDLAWHEGLSDWMPVASLEVMKSKADSRPRPRLTVVRQTSGGSPVPAIVHERVTKIRSNNALVAQAGGGDHSRWAGILIMIAAVAAVVGGFFVLNAFRMPDASGELARNRPVHAKKVRLDQEYARALEKAKSEHKLMLVHFTRSKSSAACRLFQAETLGQPAFQTYAAENLVILTIDLDQTRFAPIETKKISERFEVREYPTIIVVSNEDEMLARFPYKAGGPAAWIEELNHFRDQPATAAANF